MRTESNRLDEHRQFVTQLFERDRQPLLGYLTDLLSQRDDAEEVLQEAYVRVLDCRHLDPADGRARAYLFKVATNIAYDRFRRRKSRGERNEIAEHDLASADPSPEGMLDIEQAMDALRETLGELRPRCRRVFLMRMTEQMRYEDIAVNLRISKRTVEREMREALIACQARLRRDR